MPTVGPQKVFKLLSKKEIDPLDTVHELNSMLSTCALLLASSVAAFNATKPVFDGTFGANCPPCHQFGQSVLSKVQRLLGLGSCAVRLLLNHILKTAFRVPRRPSQLAPDMVARACYH